LGTFLIESIQKVYNQGILQTQWQQNRVSVWRIRIIECNCWL